MVKLFFDLLNSLRESAPLLISLTVLTLLFVLLAKSIKKHPGLYYTLFTIPFVLVILPSLGRIFGIEIAGFGRVPYLGELIRDYIHMGTFGHPLLIIIMYIGALDMHQKPVKRLMLIRKEMSIIVGFPVFAHSLIRITRSLSGAFQYFADNEAYMAHTREGVNVIGAGFSSFSFLLGVFMLVLFIPLWVTSFDAVRKPMGYARWKKLQKGSYILYATLFIHAMGIQIGGLLNPRGGEVTPKQYIHILSLVLIYGSYLYLRLRKAKRIQK